MTDHFDIDGKVDDRIIALSRVLCDPNLGRDVKIAEIASVCRRIDVLEGQREKAEHLSVVADLAAMPKDEPERRGRCIGCRTPGPGFCGGCGSYIDDSWNGTAHAR